VLDAVHEAHEPPEGRGVRRDGVRLLVSDGLTAPVHTRFTELGSHLDPGDVLVVNTSSTIPAALDAGLPDGEPVVVHLSGSLPGDVWLVEVREPHDGATRPRAVPEPVWLALLAGGTVRLLMPYAGSRRLWLAQVAVGGDVLDYACRHGRAIRYRHVFHDWPIANYRTLFGAVPGSAEMPSASHPFTGELLADLVRRGILFVPVLLHTGVSSLEGGEQPYPERYRVDEPAAATINAVRERGGRVVAVGTTVVRALATVTGRDGRVHPGAGWTDVVVTPTSPLPAVDGLVTGWHEPEASHLWMLEAVAGRAPVEHAYAEAFARGYLWHEFGDSHLLLRGKVRR
jgi:S-adenosylmethionine:tRNA ribosyltransferase-isomerase